MTLREIFNGIINFISNLFNKILDFDLTGLLTFLGFLIYIFYIIWLIRKASKYMEKNFNKSSTIKKIGHVFNCVLMIFVLIIMPIYITIDVFG